MKDDQKKTQITQTNRDKQFRRVELMTRSCVSESRNMPLKPVE